MFTSVILSLLLVGSVLATPAQYAEDVGTISKVGNRISVKNPKTYNFVVSIEFESVMQGKIYISNCVGVIIQPNAILTAAHCILLKTRQTIGGKVTAGIVHLKHEANIATSIELKGYKIHENYKRWKINLFGRSVFQKSDIAIVWLKTPLNFKSTIAAAMFPLQNYNVENKLGKVVGWGDNECGEATQMLQEVTLKGTTHKKCLKSLKSTLIDNKKQLCFESTNGKSMPSCGDSGSPLIYKGKVLGLLSFGGTRPVIYQDGTFGVVCDSTKPAIFTNIFSYQSWIFGSLANGEPKTLCIHSKSRKFCKFGSS